MVDEKIGKALTDLRQIGKKRREIRRDVASIGVIIENALDLEQDEIVLQDDHDFEVSANFPSGATVTWKVEHVHGRVSITCVCGGTVYGNPSECSEQDLVYLHGTLDKFMESVIKHFDLVPFIEQKVRAQA